MHWAAPQPRLRLHPNRLVALEAVPSGGLTGEGAESARYEYNGLHWRTRRMLPKQYGTSPSYFGTEEWRYFYSAAWQLLEERVDEDADSTFEIDQLAQQFWGLRHIDDAVARRVTSDWEEGWDRGYYHITNVQFSTESLISEVCELVERIRYDAYGRARHIWRGDLDQDGTFWFIDRNLGLDHIAGSSIGDNGSWPSENYNVLMDFDFSGTIESDEYDAIQNDPDAAALAAGRMSDSDFAFGPWNPIGYDGYVYDDAADMSCVRFRWYDAKHGRWVSRDPVGLIGGRTRYEYGHSDPRGFTDPLGLDPELWEFGGINNRTPYVLDKCRRFAAGLSDAKRSWSSELGREDEYRGRYQRGSTIGHVSGDYHKEWIPNLTSCGIQAFVDPDTSEAQLDGEAECFANREPAGYFCCNSPDAPKPKIRLIMIAPKTNTTPSAPCCDFQQIVYYSPFDNVPNQAWGNAGGPDDPFWWAQNFTEVRIVYTPANTGGKRDPMMSGKLITGEPYHNHSIEAYLPCVPFVEMPNASPGYWPRSWKYQDHGAANEIEKHAANKALTVVGVCHSQGCNIAMHVINRMCSPDPNANSNGSGGGGSGR